jgi:hypothetical protein
VPEERIREDLERLVDQVASIRATRARSRLRRPRRLPRPDRIAAIARSPRLTYALLQSLLLAALVEAGMRLLPLPRLARLARVRLSFEPTDRDPHEPPSPYAALTPRQRSRIWATDRIYAIWPLGDTCLRRALVLGFHLRAENPLLRIGVAGEAARPASDVHNAGPVAAHAWIETPDVTLLAQPGFESLTSGTNSPPPSRA